MKKQFNTGFVEIRTLEGEKFLKDLRITDSILGKDGGFYKIESLNKISSNLTEDVFTIYYHTKEKEGVLARIYGEIEIYQRVKVKDLRPGDELFVQGKYSKGIVDYIEKMETINKYFYNIQITGNSFYADGVCLFDK